MTTTYSLLEDRGCSDLVYPPSGSASQQRYVAAILLDNVLTIATSPLALAESGRRLDLSTFLNDGRRTRSIVSYAWIPHPADVRDVRVVECAAVGYVVIALSDGSISVLGIESSPHSANAAKVSGTSVASTPSLCNSAGVADSLQENVRRGGCPLSVQVVRPRNRRPKPKQCQQAFLIRVLAAMSDSSSSENGCATMAFAEFSVQIDDQQQQRILGNVVVERFAAEMPIHLSVDGLGVRCGTTRRVHSIQWCVHQLDFTEELPCFALVVDHCATLVDVPLDRTLTMAMILDKTSSRSAKASEAYSMKATVTDGPWSLALATMAHVPNFLARISFPLPSSSNAPGATAVAVQAPMDDVFGVFINSSQGSRLGALRAPSFAQRVSSSPSHAGLFTGRKFEPKTQLAWYGSKGLVASHAINAEVVSAAELRQEDNASSKESVVRNVACLVNTANGDRSAIIFMVVVAEQSHGSKQGGSLRRPTSSASLRPSPLEKQQVMFDASKSYFLSIQSKYVVNSQDASFPLMSNKLSSSPLFRFLLATGGSATSVVFCNIGLKETGGLNDPTTVVDCSLTVVTLPMTEMSNDDDFSISAKELVVVAEADVALANDGHYRVPPRDAVALTSRDGCGAQWCVTMLGLFLHGEPAPKGASSGPGDVGVVPPLEFFMLEDDWWSCGEVVRRGNRGLVLLLVNHKLQTLVLEYDSSCCLMRVVSSPSPRGLIPVTNDTPPEIQSLLPHLPVQLEALTSNMLQESIGAPLMCAPPLRGQVGQGNMADTAFFVLSATNAIGNALFILLRVMIESAGSSPSCRCDVTVCDIFRDFTDCCPVFALFTFRPSGDLFSNAGSVTVAAPETVVATAEILFVACGSLHKLTCTMFKGEAEGEQRPAFATYDGLFGGALRRQSPVPSPRAQELIHLQTNYAAEFDAYGRPTLEGREERSEFQTAVAATTFMKAPPGGATSKSANYLVAGAFFNMSSGASVAIVLLREPTMQPDASSSWSVHAVRVQAPVRDSFAMHNRQLCGIEFVGSDLYVVVEGTKAFRLSSLRLSNQGRRIHSTDSVHGGGDSEHIWTKEAVTSLLRGTLNTAKRTQDQQSRGPIVWGTVGDSSAWEVVESEK